MKSLKRTMFLTLSLLTVCSISFFLLSTSAFAQAGRRSTEENKKKNPGATGSPEQEQKRAEKEAEKQVDKSFEQGTIKIGTEVVNVEAVVYNKKTGAIFQGLKAGNFEIYEDGIKQEVVNFTPSEAPITLAMVLEYSKWVDVLGSPTGGMWEPGRVEILRPAYEFVRGFVKPKDFISILAYDLRPTPIVDFTDDKNRMMQAIQLMIRNNPAFSESNLFDALNFVLRGGKGDAVVLEDGKDADKNGQAEYAGLYEVNARPAILLICSGLDTFSKINFDQARKIVENSGIPIYVIGTGNLFLKKYDQYLDPGQMMPGAPDRLTFVQAQNTLKLFADSTGGKYFPVTFPGEIPSVLQSISALLRNQYSMAYSPTNTRREGKRRKIQVKVDLGDQIDPKLIVVQHRQSYTEPNDKKK
jgi:VWFA-related protein